MKSMEVRRQVERERGRDFADVEAFLGMDGQSRPRRELRRARESAPTVHGSVAVTGGLRNDRYVQYFYDGLDDDEKQLASHAGDVQRGQERSEVGFFSPKRMMGHAAVLLSASGGAVEVADYIHTSTDTKVAAAAYTTTSLVMARMWFMRRVRPRRLAENLNQITQKASDTENGAIMVHGASVDIGDLRPDYKDMATSSMFGRLGLDPAYMEIFDWEGLSQPYHGYVRMSPSDVVERLLATDVDPDELWATALRDKTIAMSQLQTEQQEVKQLQEESKARVAFAGIDADPDETIELDDSSVSLKTEMLTSLHEILLLGQDRYHQRQQTEAINKYRQLLEESITVSDKELNHPLSAELGVFKEILFESLLGLDSAADTPINKEDLLRINAYLQQIPSFLTDARHAEQIYSGMVKRFSDVVELPGWEQVRDRFQLAG